MLCIFVLGAYIYVLHDTVRILVFHYSTVEIVGFSNFTEPNLTQVYLTERLID